MSYSLRQDWTLGFSLFLATAAVVIWQNYRIGVLFDLSYVLENSYRISLGEAPYRDFPFPFAPLTFITQAAIIKLTGRVFFHHVVYAAIVGGLGTVLTWRILLKCLSGVVVSPKLIAFLLSLPLTVLGIYCIFPHPFYDPDCTFFILLSVLLLQHLESEGFPPLQAFFTGAVLIVPVFVKQNTGLAFLSSTGLVIAFLMGIKACQRRPVRGYAWLIVGCAAGLTTALIIIQHTVGLSNYVRWTLQYATSRRLPTLGVMLSTYRNDLRMWWIAVFGLGLLLWYFSRSRRELAFLSIALMSVPFFWILVSLFIEKDPMVQGKRLLALWPFLLLVCTVLAIWRLWKERLNLNISILLPFILVGTINGSLLSQQVWGSTYGIWPLLILLFASTLLPLMATLQVRFSWGEISLAVIMALSLLVSGGYYIWRNQRLNYLQIPKEEIFRSKLLPLKGLSIRGHWISDFEELVNFAEHNIPRQDGLLMIPGEDLFYYTTGRHPRFPVMMFERTINPYQSLEILELSRTRNIRWLVVKRDYQIASEQVEDKANLLALLSRDFKQVTRLRNYTIYRRK